MKPQITIKDLFSFDRTSTVQALVLSGLGCVLMIQFVFSPNHPPGELGWRFALFWIGLAVFLASALWVDGLRRRFRLENKIEEVEQRLQESPRQVRPVWELARAKLEDYLDRNLAQVQLIFLLTVAVSTAGFGLLAFGVFKAFSQPQSIAPAVLTAVSGIFVQFVGATYLAIHRSTMAQAGAYVDVLERINAVGMSVQILESIEGEDPADRNSVRTRLTQDLLTMYSLAPRSAHKAVREPRSRRG